MSGFKHSYKTSARVLAVLLALSCVRSLASGEFLGVTVIIAILVGAMPFLPILLRGGLDRNWRLAVSISVLLAVGFTGLLGFVFFEFVRNKGLEGPNGEGAPGVAILAMVFFDLTFQCPWLLAALRGIRCLRGEMKNAEQ